MSIVLKKSLHTLAAILALGALSAPSSAFAQTSSPEGASSVLPSGGGAALLDPSDTVICSIIKPVCSRP